MLFSKIFKKEKKVFTPQFVKVCGMRETQNIIDIVYAGASVIGLDFRQNNPQYVTQLSTCAGLIPDVGSIDYSNRTNLKQILTERGVSVCGVFADDMPQTIVARVVNFNLDMVQLNGNESPIMIANLRNSLDPDICPGIQIMKTINVTSKANFEQCKQYEDYVDYFLFDTHINQKSKQHINWDLLKAYKGKIPFFLSGDISECDVEAIRSIQHPMCIGVEINKQFETAAAQKDATRVEQFITQLQSLE